MRLAGKIAVVVGAGQSPGEGIGNGRATVLRFAEEGARILAVDRDLASDKSSPRARRCSSRNRTLAPRRPQCPEARLRRSGLASPGSARTND
jgi:NAD(P)-dependent dehydrogenase (short-subunit alcohol dehydrogenase family)